MKKRILSFLALLCFCCALLPSLLLFSAALEPDRPCSLTLHYERAGIGLEHAEVAVFRVAEALEDGSHQLISPYSSYPVNIHGIKSQTEWQNVASTLTAYIEGDGLLPTATAITDETGTALFHNLQTGLYLVAGVTAETRDGICVFDPFMIYLPTPTEEGLDYDVEAWAKPGDFTPWKEYRIIKLWQDQGNVEARPVSVTVDILENGVVRDSVALSPGNSWSHSWTDPDGAGFWTVVERNVPDAYQVVIRRIGNCFVIINTWEPEDPEPTNPTEPSEPTNPTEPSEPTEPSGPTDPTGPGNPTEPAEPTDPAKPTDPDNPRPDIPQTGDTAPLWLYVIIMCIAGLLFVVLGLGFLRGGKNEKKK